MVALKPQSRRCAAAIAALSSAALLSSMPASAASPVDSDETSITGDPSNAPEAAPTSSASLAADDLAALRTGNIEDFARFTPGLEIDTALGVSNPAIFIRGIGLTKVYGNLVALQDADFAVEAGEVRALIFPRPLRITRRPNVVLPTALLRPARCLPRWKRNRIAETDKADRGRRTWSPPRFAF